MNESKSKCGISSLKLGKILGQKQIEDYELTVLEIVISKDFQSRINFAVLNQ